MNLDKRLLRLALDSRLNLFLTIGFGLAGGVASVMQAYLLSKTIDRAFLKGQGVNGLQSLLAALLVIIVLRAGLAWASEISANAIAARVKISLRTLLFEHILMLGPAYTYGERTGELTSVVTEGVEALDAYFSQYLPQLVLAALVPLTFLIFVFPLDPLSGIVLLLTAPLIPLFMVLIGGLAQSLTRRQWTTLSRLSAYFLDILQGLTTLKTLGRSRGQAETIALASERFRQTTMSVLRVTFLSALVLELVSTISTAVVAVEVGLRLLYGRLSFEQAFFVLLLAPEFYLPLRMLGTRFHAGMSGAAAANRIFEILEKTIPGQDPEYRELPALVSSSLEPSLPGTIQFDQVSYSYADGRPALHGVSFQIEPGQILALVGPSGSGKTTLAQLLLKFLEPDNGEIKLSGIPLSSISAQAWREKIAFVPQNPYLFYGTILDNIRLARPQASREEIIQAACQARADEFIRGLADGYETVIGERAVTLSGGQAQRLALARAFLKNAPLIILDEATANLDPENEAALQPALRELLAGRTTLMIAHRLSTVTQADQILVLKDGRVVERGDHAALLAQKGYYSQLVSAYHSDHIRLTSQSDSRNLSLRPSAEPVVSAPPQLAVLHTEAGPLRSPLRQLLSLIAPFKAWIALSVLMGFATIGSSIGLLTSSAFIIAKAALQPSIAELQVAIVGVRFFGITRGVFRYLERYTTHQVTFRLLARLRVWFYQALEPLAPARLASFRSGDLLARMMDDIESLENFYVRALAPPLVAVLVAGMTGYFLARFDLTLAFNLLILLGLAGLGVPILTRRLSRTPGRQLVAARSGLNTSLVDGIQGLADLLVFGQGQRQLAKITDWSEQLHTSQAKLAGISGLQSALSLLLANLGLWSTLIIAIQLLGDGQIEGVYLGVLVMAALTSFEAVQPLPQAAQYLESNLESARRLLEIVQAAPAVEEPSEPVPLPADFALTVQNLSFRYPGPVAARLNPNLPDTISDLTFSLPQGARLAIVGPSGAGKSTLVHLLLRFWEFYDGEIMLGGRALRTFNPDELRRRIGVISQNTYLFNASLADNLRLARPAANQTDIKKAVAIAQLTTFIEKLPEGYDTWIGEQGLRLSGGERQRLAIARALLKDPPLLILDEATANLDAITERQVLGAIRTAMQGRTTLMITHRLVEMDSMDEILVMDRGRVVERGRHASLLAAGGLYARMWYLQNQVLAEV
jgi:ATP-binding cassette, subfamily C, bacterial CydCD